MARATGTTIGQYTLAQLIMRDDLGEVYRAHHGRDIGHEVRIRLLADEWATDPVFVARFERGLITLARLTHPQIVPILGYGEAADAYYLATPMLGGDTMQDDLARGPLTPGRLLAYLRPIADALDYAHSGDVSHGDLHPANIHRDSQGTIILADFGIAWLAEASMGAARTAVPEQGVDPRDDIYDLGRIAYLGLTGDEPGGAPSRTALAEWPATLPTFRRVLAMAPAERHASAGAFVRELAAALATTAEEQSASSGCDRAPESPPVSPDSDDLTAATRPQVRPGSPKATAFGGLVPRSSAARSVFAVWVVAIALLGVLFLGATIVLGGSGTSDAPRAAAARPTTVPPQLKAVAAVQALAPAPDLPYQFPVNNELIARKYADAVAHLPNKVSGDAKLQRFAAECYDPRGVGDCLLVYVFYSKQANQMYNYHYKVLEDTLVGDFLEPVPNDDARIVFNELPWAHNPNWTNLLRESYAQLPVNFAPGGYMAGLVGNAAALNTGSSDWTMVYVETATKRQVIFELLGETVRKLPE